MIKMKNTTFKLPILVFNFVLTFLVRKHEFVDYQT